jgi:hypothetical protein
VDSDEEYLHALIPDPNGFTTRRIIVKSRIKRMPLGVAIAGFVLILATGCSNQSNSNPGGNKPSASSTPTSSSSPTLQSILYKNAKYGFTFSLPKSWTGYSIVNSKWQGNDVKTGAISETGAMISVRHPLWTAAHLRQDIPIFIFTVSQWSSLQKSIFHIGAAPIPPSELGRNSKYVFALPARYNFAFPTGFQEVDQILQSNPLHTN